VFLVVHLVEEGVLSGRTLIAALKRYRVWIGIRVSFVGDRLPGF